MSDLIDRQAALEVLDWKWAGKAAIDAIKNLPSAQPDVPDSKVGKWIPCSERLPEDGRLVLTTIIGTDIIYLDECETLEDAVKRSMGMKRVSVGFIGSDGWYGADGYPEIVTPRAWMPLPEPWKGEEDA